MIAGVDIPSIKSHLRSWLCKYNPTVNVEDISFNSDLFESEVLDSLGAIALVIELETLLRKTIDPSTLDISNLRSIDSIVRTYFHGN